MLSRRVVALALCAAGAFALTLSTPAQAVRPATAAACMPIPRAIGATDSARLAALADRKLAKAAEAANGRFPFGALRAESQYVARDARKWSSGFFTASLWRAYERTRDDAMLQRARSFTDELLPVATFTGSHDLNFMVGLPVGLGAALDPDPDRRARYADAVETAARTLDLRWNGNVKALQSSEYEGQWAVIVDSAMNAPLLIEVGQRIGGDEGDRLVKHGVQHMRTLARTFVRPDGSTFHRIAFDPQTGAVVGPIPGQGLDETSSTWSRGQAWTINGFAQAYALTKDPEFREVAERTATFWMQNVRAGCIPSWDFDVSNTRSPLDSGSAAIAMDGLLTLAQATGRQDLAQYARTTLATLTAPWLLSTYSVNPGLLLQQSVNVPEDPREGSYVWGDYYLLAAVAQS